MKDDVLVLGVGSGWDGGVVGPVQSSLLTKENWMCVRQRVIESRTWSQCEWMVVVPSLLCKKDVAGLASGIRLLECTNAAATVGYQIR